jgi:nicotinate-nucleotide adenylyltransferase
MNKRKIGIFGGTFNPPHIGHVASAKSFLEQMELDELLIIPTYVPPHKDYTSAVSCEQRLQMCRLAFADIPKATVSDIEIKRRGTSYTYLTLEELYSDEVELYMLCGTDMILSLDRWKNSETIFKLAAICYIRRENEIYNSIEISNKINEYTINYGAEIHEIECEPIQISSSEIRIASEKLKFYLPKNVYDYIIEMGLYV